ncbi:MAG TPA: hypothetical protein VKY19_12470 [Ktedonosporobacter sp.]|jgi:hypothetical protein|nr:hypothetical protein [Ktedonosporobacter sp.]
MNFEDESFDDTTEKGSDELLSDDNLRLPENANVLVRLHAIRAWLTRRQQETTIEMGENALALQEAMQEGDYSRLRRREREALAERLQHAQETLHAAQLRLETYEEAETLLEDCITHTTSGERVLVEYYLMLEELLNDVNMHEDASSPRLRALADVQHRVERVGAPGEE